MVFLTLPSAMEFVCGTPGVELSCTVAPSQMSKTGFVISRALSEYTLWILAVPEKCVKACFVHLAAFPLSG